MGLRSQFTEIKQIHEGRDKGPISIAGWVRTRRGSKHVAFLEINDGSSARSIQAVIDESSSVEENVLNELKTGCAVQIEGALRDSPAKGQDYEIGVERVKIVGGVDENYPLQKKKMSFEFLREQAHLRPRTRTISSALRIASQASLATHRFFDEEGFQSVHTPILTASDAEGAGHCFNASTFDFKNVPRTEEGDVDYSEDFFGEQAMLCVTGQLQAELLISGLAKVYTFGPAFRAENSHTARHLCEFWMVEPEMAFWDLDDTIDLADRYIRYVTKEVLERCKDDFDVLAKRSSEDRRTFLQDSLKSPLQRISYTEAIDVLKSAKKKFEYPVEWGADLQTEHERYICETHFNGPTVVYDYPKDIKAFYMYQNDDGKTVRAMDLLIPYVGELVGGSQREHREAELLRAITERNMNPAEYEWYLETRRYGTVPHSGFGAGFGRLCMW
ncbi:MAG: asparagine--tRNA ligase, partial [Myxococcota bacterium]